MTTWFDNVPVVLLTAVIHIESVQVLELTDLLRRDVQGLHLVLRERMEEHDKIIRKIDSMEELLEENAKLRTTVNLMQRTQERRDLDFAAMQGQLDALTKMVRESRANCGKVERIVLLQR